MPARRSASRLSRGGIFRVQSEDPGVTGRGVSSPFHGGQFIPGSRTEVASRRLDPDTARRLKVVAALNDRSLQSLGVEAADLMIERYSKGE